MYSPVKLQRNEQNAHCSASADANGVINIPIASSGVASIVNRACVTGSRRRKAPTVFENSCQDLSE